MRDPVGDRVGDRVRDRGQAAVTMMVLVAVLFVTSIAALSAFGQDVTDRSRAETVADAAALAGVVTGRAGSERIVGRHGASMVSWVDHGAGDTITVVVRIGDATATARATRRP